MATAFSAFKQSPYTFLEISRGNVYGNTIIGERNLTGIFKQRANQTDNGNIELYTSTATLHAHPEDFAGIATPDLIGQGIRADGIEYEIINATEGKNFDTGIIEHLTFTLQRADYAS